MTTDAHTPARWSAARLLYGLLVAVSAAGLLVVLAAAATLSFAGLRDLAVSVRIHRELAWLLPVAVDAGAAVSTVIWLAPGTRPDAARFARLLTWALLALTVAANASGLGMAAAGLVPPWWVSVAVGAIPPAVAGGVVHLIVLVIRPAGDTDGDGAAQRPAAIEARTTVESPGPPPEQPPGPPAVTPPAGGDRAAPEPVRLHVAKTAPGPSAERARLLVARGASQAELVDELGLKTRHQARMLQAKPERAEEFLAKWAAG